MVKRPANITPERVKVEAMLEADSTPLTPTQISERAGIDPVEARRIVKVMRTYRLLNIVGKDGKEWTYQSIVHAPPEAPKVRESLVTNSSMPNGDQDYWRRHMAWQNTPARQDAGK